MARTARQRAALRKAQLASARKRKGRGRRVAKIAAGVAVAAGAGYAAHKYGKKYASKRMRAKVRKHLNTDPARVHNRSVIRAQRQNKKYGTKDTLTDNSVIFARAMAKRRVASRKTKRSRRGKA